MKPRLAIALFGALIVLAAPTFDLAQAQPDSSYSGPTIGPAPPITCHPNETFEWRPTPGCGRYGESPASIPGEYRCWNYYDSISNSCQRRCEWTGNCRAP